MPRLALLLTTLIWGATFPATKAALEQITPLSFLLLRFSLGTLLIVLWFLVSRRRLHHDRAVLAAGALSTVFLFLGYTLQTVGLHRLRLHVAVAEGTARRQDEAQGHQSAARRGLR